MKLYISDNPNIDITFDSVIMPSYEFNDVRCHPYIVGTGFDVAVVDICNCKVKIPYIERLMTILPVIPIITDELNDDGISILSALYKDKAAALRMNYLNDDPDLDNVIKELSDKYKWKEFY